MPARRARETGTVRPSGRQRRTGSGLLVAAVTSLALLAGGCSTGDESDGGGEGPVDKEAAALASGPPWRSGVWLGGALDDRKIHTFGRWRGDPADTVTTYPAYDTWKEIETSDWHVSTFNGFQGRLVYGLPLLPSEQKATLQDVARGKHDKVWRSVARTLVRHGRADSYVRIGLEANGTWFPWGATATTADDFRRAYRHVATVMAKEGPELQFVFDISCGVALEGAEHDRMASLTRLYPGDDVVDVVGCDHYDSWTAIARDSDEWSESVRPENGAGLVDVVSFARRHKKQFAVPEWGLTARHANGAGDNPYFVRRMFAFFKANRDVLAFENYFDEPDDYLGSSLFQESQNPKSAAVYRELW
jgi:hypothetical protein